MRSTFIMATCLLSFGLFATTAPAETFATPAALTGTYATDIPTIDNMEDWLWASADLLKSAQVDVGTQFQGITQITVHLVGVMQQAYFTGDPVEGGGSNLPTWLEVRINGVMKKTSNLRGMFDSTLTFPITQPTSVMLAGQIQVSVDVNYQFGTIGIGGGGHTLPPVCTMTRATIEVTGTHVPGSLKADFNGDDSVDVVDLLTFIDTFGLGQGEPNYNAACDLNGDNSVDVVDLLTFVGLFGNPQ